MTRILTIPWARRTKWIVFVVMLFVPVFAG